MADNKVVIKINYDKDKHRKQLIDPKMVTVWHTGRILSALIILLLLAFAIYGLFSGNNNNKGVTQPKQNVASPVAVSPRPVADIKPDIIQTAPQQLKDTQQTSIVNRSKISNKQVSDVKRPAAIILDKRVIRASINMAPKNGEPGDAVKLPLQIEQNQTLELFYFSQVKNMLNKVLLHHWYKDGQLQHKKQFTVKSNNEKLVSSKKFSENDVGEWRVVLVNNKGKSLSEVNYLVRH